MASPSTVASPAFNIANSRAEFFVVRRRKTADAEVAFHNLPRVHMEHWIGQLNSSSNLSEHSDLSRRSWNVPDLDMNEYSPQYSSEVYSSEPSARPPVRWFLVRGLVKPPGCPEVFDSTATSSELPRPSEQRPGMRGSPRRKTESPEASEAISTFCNSGCIFEKNKRFFFLISRSKNLQTQNPS